MKRLIAAFCVIVMVFSLSACNSKKAANEEYDQIIASYSKKIDDKVCLVRVQNLGGVYDELYDKDGLKVKLYSKAKILDAEGKEISIDDLFVGNTLIISYDGTLSKKNPKTIKAYEIKVHG